MNRNDIKAAMVTIADELIDTDTGAHWLGVKQEFETRFAGELEGFTLELRDDYLRLRAKEVVAAQGRRGNAQLKLPGFPDIDATVTCSDGEGEFYHKSTRRATELEMVEDEIIQHNNAIAADASWDRAKLRNRVLRPIMAAHGFRTAGEAIDFLNGGGAAA